MTQIGRYKIINRLASGGMAEIYHAQLEGEAGFCKDVVIKRLRPGCEENGSYVEMLIDEGRALTKLQHKNIVQIFDLDKQGDDYFLVMEYICGVDLRKIISKVKETEERIPLELGVYIISQVLEGLSFAQKELSIVHRDISPSNILLSWRGDVKVADFGIAKGIHRQSNTTHGELKGKFAYMSPEQALGLTLDARSDVFSCGIILYELITGRRLFDGRSDMEVLGKVRDSIIPVDSLKEIPAELRMAILTALAKEPCDRFQNAGEFLAAVNDISERLNLKAFDFQLGTYIRNLLPVDKEMHELKHPQDTRVIQKVFSWSKPAALLACAAAALFISSDAVSTGSKAKAVYANSVMGSVEINSAPKGAAGTLSFEDTVMKFTTPWKTDKINIDKKIDMKLELKKMGYKKANTILTLTRDKPDARVTYALLPIATSYLSISARPWGIATIKGRFQDQETPINKISIPPGNYVVRVANGDKLATQSISIRPKQHLKCFASFPESMIECR